MDLGLVDYLTRSAMIRSLKNHLQTSDLLSIIRWKLTSTNFTMKFQISPLTALPEFILRIKR